MSHKKLKKLQQDGPLKCGLHTWDRSISTEEWFLGVGCIFLLLQRGSLKERGEEMLSGLLNELAAEP